MLSRRTENARVWLFVLDQLLLAAAFSGAFLLKRHVVMADPELDAAVYARLYLISAPFLAMALSACGFYRLAGELLPPSRVRGRDLVWGGFLCMVVLVLAGYMIKPVTLEGADAPRWSRAIAFLFMGTSAVALGLARKLLTAASIKLRGEPERLAKLVVFGNSPRILKLLGVFQRTPHLHVTVVGIAADDAPEDVAPRLSMEEAMELLEQGRVDHVLVEAGGMEPERIHELLHLADREGISVHITASIFPSTRLVPAWERIGGVPLLGFVSAELPFGARVSKRIFDFAVSAAALAVLIVPMLLLALIIRIDSSGTPVFVQRRVGARGRVFPMLKFRTMCEDAEARTGPVFAVENDARCTSLGRFLRRWNIDELPQLFNVLLGHMSLVGPRPERPEFVGGFKRKIPRYAHKHWVKPGITGWAQVHGLRGASTSLQSRIDHDLYYIEHWSLMFDIRILVRTLIDGYVNAV